MHLEDVKKIGEGGQGSAFLCRDLSTGKTVVAKRTTQFETKGRGYAREVHILKDCLPRHPNVLRMLAYNQRSRQLETVYEFCNKGSLADRIPKKGDPMIKEDFLWHVLGQMAQALAFIHHGINLNIPGKSKHDPLWKRPVLHRDLSPDNIFLRTSKHKGAYPDIVLGELGFATTELETWTTMKPNYQPPEYPNMTKKADVWALGVIIHKLGCARGVISDPPRGWKYDEWVEQKESKRPRDLPSFYSSTLNKVMWECLHPSEQKRINARDLLNLVKRKSPLKVVGLDR